MHSGWTRGANRRTHRITALVAGLLLALAAIGLASAQTSWLDAPPKAWNVSGAAIPTAPPTQLAQPICLTRERPASEAEEAQVAATGWRLESYWPILRRGNLAIVQALSDYDGMCRPYAFNGFVFANGKFVGTLSPVNMFSRQDGVLRTAPVFPSDGVVQALFTRYAPTDPLCCASLPVARVTYRLINGVIAPVTITSLPKAPISTPRTPPTLPRAGDPFSPLLPVAAGLTLIVAGAVWRRSGPSSD